MFSAAALHPQTAGRSVCLWKSDSKCWLSHELCDWQPLPRSIKTTHPGLDSFLLCWQQTTVPQPILNCMDIWLIWAMEYLLNEPLNVQWLCEPLALKSRLHENIHCSTKLLAKPQRRLSSQWTTSIKWLAKNRQPWIPQKHLSATGKPPSHRSNKMISMTHMSTSTDE